MNDLDLYDPGGELAPYTPAPSPLPASSPAGLPVDFLGERAEYGQGGAVTWFGQRLPAGVTAEAAQQVVTQMTAAFAGAMQQHRVPDAHWRAAVDWFHGAALAPPPRDVAAAHRYDLHGLAFLPEDHALVHAFAGAMQQRGLPQASVHRMLAWYSDLTQKVFKAQQPQQNTGGFTDAELDAIDDRADADREAGLNALRVAWGHEFSARLGLVRRYVKNLPEREREHIENAVLPGGQMAANDPGLALKLYDEATGGHLPSGGNLQQEINVLEARMKNDRRAWFKDDAAQARLRRLYQQRDGG